jgi:hypothetical protein
VGVTAERKTMTHLSPHIKDIIPLLAFATWFGVTVFLMYANGRWNLGVKEVGLFLLWPFYVVLTPVALVVAILVLVLESTNRAFNYLSRSLEQVGKNHREQEHNE